MSHCEHSGQYDRSNTRRLIAALAIVLVFMAVEVVGGLLSGSLALLADATHMLTDALALALAASAQLLARRPADRNYHFGYRRMQVLAAFVNGLLMCILLVWIIIEAIARFREPVEIDAPLMMSVALAGLLANAVVFWILHRRADRDNVNMRGAMLHVVGDLLGSVAAIIAALVIFVSGWRQIDPILSLVVAMLISYSAFRLIRDTGYILLEGAPERINVNELADEIIAATPAITDVHDIQISQITPDDLRLTMHARVAQAGDAAGALAKAKAVLARKYKIRRSTIQIEINGACPDRADPVGRAASAPASSRQAGDDSALDLRRSTPA